MLLTTSLIVASPPSPVPLDVTLQRIRRESGRASFLAAALADESTLALADSTFTHCTATRGDAASLGLAALPPFSFSASHSTARVATLSIERSMDHTLRRDCTPLLLPFLPWEDAIDKEAMAKLGTAGPAILSHLFRSADISPSLLVSPSPLDAPACSAAQAPCRTVNTAFRSDSHADPSRPSIPAVGATPQEEEEAVTLREARTRISALVEERSPVFTPAPSPPPHTPLSLLRALQLLLSHFTLPLHTSAARPCSPPPPQPRLPSRPSASLPPLPTRSPARFCRSVAAHPLNRTLIPATSSFFLTQIAPSFSSLAPISIARLSR